MHPFLFILVCWLCPELLYAAITWWLVRGAYWPSTQVWDQSVSPSDLSWGFRACTLFGSLNGRRGKRSTQSKQGAVFAGTAVHAPVLRFWLIPSTRLMSPDWGWRGGHHTPFSRKEDNSGFGSISQVGVLFWRLYFHWLSQLHGSCSQLPSFLPSTLCNTAHSEKEEYKRMTHICFFSDSGALGRMFKILSISKRWGQGREQRCAVPLLATPKSSVFFFGSQIWGLLYGCW